MSPQHGKTLKSATIANLETNFEVGTIQWGEEGKAQTFIKIAINEEKDKFIKSQENKLQELLHMCNAPKSEKVPLPIIRDTRTVNQVNKMLTEKVRQHIKKGILVKPFKKGSRFDFNIWKSDLANILSISAGSEYSFEIVDELCIKFLDSLIPHYSDAKKYLEMVLPDFLDETGKIKVGTKFFTIMDSILHIMQLPSTRMRTQMLAKKPFWNKYKDNATKFIDKYEAYLRQRLDIQFVSTYLDNNEALKISEFMDFSDAIPPIIRKEVKLYLNANISWEKFTDQYIEAEAMLAYNNPHYKLNS